MSLTVTCPDCDKTLKVKDDAAGKKVRCPACSKIFSVPAKSNDPDDDFLSGLDAAASPKRKRRDEEDDLDDDDDDLPVDKPRAKKPLKKRSGKGKSSGTNWLLIGGLSGAALVAVVFLAILVAAIGQARKNRSGQLATWPTFRHPSGTAQIDMPGVPTLNVQQSQNGAQTYSLALRNYQMSLISITLPGAAQAAVASNPAAIDLMFNEMETKTPQQIPGSKMISKRRMNEGAIRGLELKVDISGNINLMRFYVFPEALICAEFISKNESAYESERQRFFNSLRGPNGNLIIAGAQTPGVPVASGSTPSAGAGTSAKSLSEARRALKTSLVKREHGGPPVPNPPAALARTVRYDAPSGKLAAYLTTIPPDGKKHPAIIWVSGGDCNSIDDGFFKESPPSNDQTASAFWKAGVVTMYVSLRGGNDNPGDKEGFLGEIDDVIAASDFLSKQEGIDPDRIYLGGHSTGGTVALLAAESTNHFRAVFSFGPAADIRGYGDQFLVFDSRIPAELEARTPSKWLGSIQNRTFVLEGNMQPGNLQAVMILQSMLGAQQDNKVTCLIVLKANHFNILAPVTKLIAQKILKDEGPTTNITIEQTELFSLNFAQ